MPQIYLFFKFNLYIKTVVAVARSKDFLKDIGLFC
jgi:hypothetical protein